MPDLTPANVADMKRYVGFTEADAGVLRRLARALAPHTDALAEQFGARALADPTARRLLLAAEGGPEGHRDHLVAWLADALAGPFDESLFARRAPIGRAHVRVGLPQHLVVAAMNGLRLDLRALLPEVTADEAERRAAADALDRVLDLELAALLHAYAADSEERLRRNERLAVAGQLAGSIAHELRQPLAVIDTSVHVIRRRAPADDTVTRQLDRIRGQVRTATGIITDLLEMTRDESPARSSVAVQSLADEAVDCVRLPAQVRLERALAPDLVVHVHPLLAVRALVNLLQNAATAIAHAGGTIRLEAARRGGLAAISVADDGPGFDREVLARAFEPLVTTRPHGTGLGLALVRRVCERHGGRAEARNLPGGGACVTMFLPVPPPLG